MSKDTIYKQDAIDAIASYERDSTAPINYRKIIEELPSAQPDPDEWCHDCKEYDQGRHCCPRWNRVIRKTLEDAQTEREPAHWIFIRTERDGNGLYECSACHKGDIHAPEISVPYCWNCGCKMDKRKGADE